MPSTRLTVRLAAALVGALIAVAVFVAMPHEKAARPESVAAIRSDLERRWERWRRTTAAFTETTVRTSGEQELVADAEIAQRFPDRVVRDGDDISAEQANFDERYAREPEAIGPEEVGSNPDIVSPFGLHDTAGNVWEWVQAVDGVGGNLVRGGSFYHGKVAARAANRSRLDAEFADGTLGLRVCAPLHVRASDSR